MTHEERFEERSGKQPDSTVVDIPYSHNPFRIG